MKHLFLAILLTASVAARATDVTTTAAGTLQGALGAEPQAVTTLTVAGPVNASDLHFIASLPAITTLDLSKAVIEEETNGRLATNHTTYKAGHLPAYILAGGRFTSIILPENLVEIGDGALMSTAITSLTIPATVTRIGRGALADCRNLAYLTIPATVTAVGSHVCDGDTGLKYVTCNSSVVPAYAFRGCTAMTSFEGTPAALGDYALAGCTALKSYPFDARLASIGTGAFYNSGLTKADLVTCRNLDRLGDYAFAHCPELASVRLPEGLKTIGEGAFFADEALAALNIPSTVTTLDDFSLKGTRSLDSSTGLLGDGVATIGRYGMAGMESLTNVTIPESLTSLDDYAMAGMESLATVDAVRSREVPETGENVWDGIDQSRVTLLVEPSMENQFLAAAQWNEFNITTAGIDAIEADAPGHAPGVTLSIDGTDLVATSSATIDSAAVYDLAGRCLVSVRGSATSLTIPLAEVTPQVLIVTVATAGRNVTFKIAK